MIRDEGMLEQLLSTIRNFVKMNLFHVNTKLPKQIKFLKTSSRKCVNSVYLDSLSLKSMAV